MRNTKQVPVKSLKVGDKFEVLRSDNGIIMASYKVISVNPLFVTLDRYGIKETYPTDGLYAEIPLTKEEFRRKYDYDAAEVVKQLRNEITDGNIGHHEMWNSWIDLDPWQFASNCREHEIRVLGWFYLSQTKKTMFCGDEMDIGVVAEYINEPGSRFWCHSKKDWIDDAIRSYEEGGF